LEAHYQRVAHTKFDGVIPSDYRIVFNHALRRLTGRIDHQRRLIEISREHFLRHGLPDAVATLEHELLHLYLHRLGHRGGHRGAFRRLAVEKGIRVFHDHDYRKNQSSRYRYLYECARCKRLVSRHRRRGGLACGVCCRARAAASWDARFELRLIGRVCMA
jgi:predicted SprT family Zn-dependent metalloprotease